jgi:hypothetical protein
MNLISCVSGKVHLTLDGGYIDADFGNRKIVEKARRVPHHTFHSISHTKCDILIPSASDGLEGEEEEEEEEEKKRRRGQLRTLKLNRILTGTSPTPPCEFHGHHAKF